MNLRSTFKPKFYIIFGLSLALMSISCSSDSKSNMNYANQVTIHRDSFAVAHVYGESDAAAAFGFAYAQAEDNFWQLEDNFIHSIGRACELYGNEKLLSDWINRALEIEKLAKQEYEQSNEALKALLDGYAAGYDFYIKKHPELEVRLLRHCEPWYPLAFIRYLYYQNGFIYSAGWDRMEYEVALNRSMGTDSTTGYRFTPPTIYPRSEQGSNSWAVMPAKSREDRAMLFINPHLPFFGRSQVYEGHIMSAEGWNFSGYTRFGFPLPYVGFNENLGWASTDNAADLADLYLEHFDKSDNPLAYRYGDEYRQATEWSEDIKVKTSSGLLSKKAVFRKTHHGPIVAYRNGQPMALHMAKMEESGWLDQWYSMTKADSLASFKAAVSRLDMLFGNYLYTDKKGNILYVYNAAIPIRNEKFDWSQPLDGSNPETEWQGYHTMEELPQVLNPSAGWLQNCNGTPFLSSAESDNPKPADFPNYMVRESDNARHERARQIMTQQDKFSFVEWRLLSHDTYLVQAEKDIPLFLEEWEDYRRHVLPESTQVIKAMEHLSHWDFRCTDGSEAMTYYVLVKEKLREWERKGEVPANWPRMAALENVLEKLKKDWGQWEVPWGLINRLQKVHSNGMGFDDELESLAVPGAPSWAGGMFTFWAPPTEGERRRYGVGGNSYVCILAFGEKVEAQSIHVFGNPLEPELQYYYNPQKNYTKGDYKPAWLYLEEVKANAWKSYQPGVE